MNFGFTELISTHMSQNLGRQKLVTIQWNTNPVTANYRTSGQHDTINPRFVKRRPEILKLIITEKCKSTAHIHKYQTRLELPILSFTTKKILIYISIVTCQIRMQGTVHCRNASFSQRNSTTKRKHNKYGLQINSSTSRSQGEVLIRKTLQRLSDSKMWQNTGWYSHLSWSRPIASLEIRGIHRFNWKGIRSIACRPLNRGAAIISRWFQLTQFNTNTEY